MSSLASVLSSHRIVVCVGSGGVGKTTTAAALALSEAMRGRRVLCLTIDPAKRLATSLGLSEMTTEEQAVPRALFEEQGLTFNGALSAMMLDTKKTFDDLVKSTASSPERAKRILENRLYQYISTSLAGTQEYMAMEKLHAVRNDPRYDLVVLDTPPTSNALDFLDAPERLAGLVDSPAMRWLTTAVEGGEGRRFSISLLHRGAKVVLAGMSKFTGSGFLEQVAQFVSDFNDLFGGFRARAEEVASAFRGPEVAFVVVTSPAPLAIEEAMFFSARLVEAGMRTDAVVINQVHPLVAEPSASAATLEADTRAALKAAGVEADATRIVSRMRRALDDARLRAVADRLEADRLESKVQKGALFVEVPVLDRDVHDLRSLAKVAGYLVGSEQHQAVTR